VFVTARQSTMVYKNAKIDARTIASIWASDISWKAASKSGKSFGSTRALIDGRSGLSYLGEQLR